MNAYCPPVCTDGFVGLPTAPPNPAFGRWRSTFRPAIANYNGLTISLQRRLSAGLTFTVNYTWSHALDDVSNGGVTNEPFGHFPDEPGYHGAGRIHSTSERNYGNADYDVRHYVSANYGADRHVPPCRIQVGSQSGFRRLDAFQQLVPPQRNAVHTSIDNSALGILLGLQLRH